MKILFVVPSLNITVLDNHSWLTGNVLIKNMEDSHLHNAILWCWRRHRAEEETEIGHIKMQNLTYYQWYMILKGEKKRREDLIIQSKIAELEELKFNLLPKKEQYRIKLAKIEEELNSYKEKCTNE